MKPVTYVAAALKIAPSARLKYLPATSDSQSSAMHHRFLRGNYNLPQKQMLNAAFFWLKFSFPLLPSKCSLFFGLFYLENPSTDQLPSSISIEARGN